jgi:hypothetical protein
VLRERRRLSYAIVPHVWNKEGFDMRVLFGGQQEATAPSRKRDAAAPWILTSISSVKCT